MKPSQTLSLSCTVPGFSIMSYHNQWTHQAPRKVLEWVYVVWSGGRRVEPSTEILAQHHQGHVREASLFNAEQSHSSLLTGG